MYRTFLLRWATLDLHQKKKHRMRKHWNYWMQIFPASKRHIWKTLKFRQARLEESDTADPLVTTLFSPACRKLRLPQIEEHDLCRKLILTLPKAAPRYCLVHEMRRKSRAQSIKTRELKMETFSRRRQLQPDVTSWFVQYCACSCSPHCRRAPVGDVKLVCLALWREREYLTFISIRFVAFSNQNFADYRLKGPCFLSVTFKLDLQALFFIMFLCFMSQSQDPTWSNMANSKP